MRGLTGAAAFEDAGRQLARLAGQGTLNPGLRAVLAHHLLFLFNRHGVSAADQYGLARRRAPGCLRLPGQPVRRHGAEAGQRDSRHGYRSVRDERPPASATRAGRAAAGRAGRPHTRASGPSKSPSSRPAFRTAPRHLFLPGASLDDAYSRNPRRDPPRPDGTSLSSASSPKLVATMLEQLAVQPGAASPGDRPPPRVQAALSPSSPARRAPS